MRLPWTHQEDRGAVSDRGRVACPYFPDVDIDRCYDCPRLEHMTDLGTNVRVECRRDRLVDEVALLLYPGSGA